MLGAIIGDIVGSIYEFDNIKTKDFPFFGKSVDYTDDSILTIATSDWLLHGGNAADYYACHAQGNPDPMGSYGPSFRSWAMNYSPKTSKPYGSCGNGSAMRVSPVGWFCNSMQEIFEKAKESAECTHNHPEGIKGAQATALCIYLSRHGYDKNAIRKIIEDEFHYDLSLTVDEIRPRYSWEGLDGKGDGGTCQGSVPEAIVCALEATDYEDAIRNAISIGGDSDKINEMLPEFVKFANKMPRWAFLGHSSEEIMSGHKGKNGKAMILPLNGRKPRK